MATNTDSIGNTSEFSTEKRDIQGGTCTVPLTIDCGATVNANLAFYNNHYENYACDSGNLYDAPDAMYAFILRGMGTYTVTAEISGNSLIDVFILDACGTGNCLHTNPVTQFPVRKQRR
jgi:hypothetical protein